MEFLSQLNENRQLAGLKPLSESEAVELMEKKLSGKAKEDFLAKMGGKKSKKDDDGVDGGREMSFLVPGRRDQDVSESGLLHVRIDGQTGAPASSENSR